MGDTPVGNGVITPRKQLAMAGLEAALALLMVLSFGNFAAVAMAGAGEFTSATFATGIAFLLACYAVRLVRSRFGVGRLILPVFMVALVFADLSRLGGLWPCDVGCQGGAHYQAVAGISIVWPSLAAHLALAALTIRDFRRGGWCAWTHRSVVLLAGVSGFFTVISAQLGLSCSYCFAVHALTLFSAGLAQPYPTAFRWWHWLAWFLAGWLMANAVFHHTPVADVSTPPSGTTPTVTQPTAGDAALLARIDAGRTRGRADSPATLELALDLHCESCAKLHGPLMAALAPAIADGRLKVVHRLMVRKSHPAGRAAAHLLLAAAASGDHESVLAILLGSNPQSQPDGLRARVAEDLAIAPIDAVVDGYVPVLDRVIAEDAARLAALKVGIKTPTAVLLRDGHEVGRWSGDFAPALVVDALGR